VSDRDLADVRRLWNALAEDWRIQVGDAGDANRRLNSDPVLWAFVGEVAGLSVLDAGCGTGYLTKQLADRGARVQGVDLADGMIAIARATYPGIEFHVDSVSELRSVADGEMDLVIANYVLMDTPDLQATIGSFHRVLKGGGVAVVVFSHPCFPQGRAVKRLEGERVSYAWDFPYFGQRRCVDPAWAHFTSEFIWFHRPLSDYWKAFVGAGFAVVDFEEPRLTPERYHLAESPKRLAASRTRPYSVAFKLRKE